MLQAAFEKPVHGSTVRRLEIPHRNINMHRVTSLTASRIDGAPIDRTHGTLMVTSVALSLALGPVGTVGADQARPEGRFVPPEFSVLDSDGDARLSEKEWRASPAAASMEAGVAEAHFRMYDRDEDGSVSEREYREINERAARAFAPESI